MRTIVPWFEKLVLPPQTWGLWFWRLFLPPPTPFDRMSELHVKYYTMTNALVDDYYDGTRKGVKWYEEYCEAVKKAVPEERLLVMNVKEGWEPLCAFLGKERPWWEFPRVNTIDEWYV